MKKNMLKALLRRQSRATTLIALLVISVSAVALTPLVNSPQTQKNQAVTLEILKQLDRKHFAEIPVDDSLSSRFLDNYLEKLDPSRAFFYQSDIDEFNQYRTTLDEALKAGNNDPGYEIYQRFEKRLSDRLTSVITMLKDDRTLFDFTINESISADTSNNEWLKDEKAANDYWRKRIKSFLLSEKMSGDSLDKAKEQLIKRYENRLTRLEKNKADDIYETYINAFTELYDPHTNYLAPRTAENFNINMRLSLEGIGALLQSDDEKTKIVRLITGGPAQKQGELKAADYILGVAQGDDGEMVDVVGWRLDEVVDLIRGPKDTIVRLLIDPSNPAEKGTKIVRIKRDQVKLEDQAAQKAVLDLQDEQGNTFRAGVIHIPAFYLDFQAARRGDPDYRSTTRDVFRLLKELREDNVDGVIIDLRDNGGGSLVEATTLTDLFIDRGPVVQIGKNRMSSTNSAESAAFYSGPLVVLINRLSASASEIFAGAIQDYQRGLIIGSQSFGKGTVQSLAPLKTRGDLKITESKFYRVTGESTQHRGVIPDISFPELLDTDKIGESSFDTALGWSTIAPLKHRRYYPINSLLPTLTELHNERISDNPDFLFLEEQKTLLERFDNRKNISLMESERLKEKEQFESATLNIENRRRDAKGLTTYKSFQDYKKGTEAEEQVKAARTGSDTIDTQNDALLREAGFILKDFTDLLLGKNSQKVANFSQ